MKTRMGTRCACTATQWVGIISPNSGRRVVVAFSLDGSASGLSQLSSAKLQLGAFRKKGTRLFCRTSRRNRVTARLALIPLRERCSRSHQIFRLFSSNSASDGSILRAKCLISRHRPWNRLRETRFIATTTAVRATKCQVVTGYELERQGVDVDEIARAVLDGHIPFLELWNTPIDRHALHVLLL